MEVLGSVSDPVFLIRFVDGVALVAPLLHPIEEPRLSPKVTWEQRFGDCSERIIGKNMSTANRLGQVGRLLAE